MLGAAIITVTGATAKRATALVAIAVAAILFIVTFPFVLINLVDVVALAIVIALGLAPECQHIEQQDPHLAEHGDSQ